MNKTLLLVFVVACGSGGKKTETANTGGDPPVSPTTTTANDDVYGGAAYGGYRIMPSLTAFKDGIATKASIADACPASKSLRAAAVEIEANPPPPQATSAEIWNGEAHELAAISEDFVAHCAGTDAEMTKYDLDSMHRSFQRLLLLLPAS